MADENDDTPLQLGRGTPGDGRQIRLVLSADQAKALQAMLSDRMWWDGFLRRAKKWGVVVAAGFVFLAALSSWWPWVTSMVKALIRDVPK